MVEGDLRKLQRKFKNKNKNVWKIIKEIGSRNDVIIRPVDKGGGLVILNEADYEEEMENLLGVENTYKKLNT